MQRPIRNVLRNLGVRGVPYQERSDRPAPRHSGTYTRDNSEIADESFDELTPVRVICMVCKGRIFLTKETINNTSYAKVRCWWCTEGSMSGEQVNNYLNRDKIIETLVRDYLKE